MNGFLPEIHWTNLLIIPGILIGYTIHELAHTVTAYYFGDNSQVERGKFTLNPFRHVSWFGAIAFLLVGIGWPNPLEVKLQSFKNRPVALAITAIIGPVASLTFALAAWLFTLIMMALLVFETGTTTDGVLPFFFPLLSATPPDSLNWQALTLAFTTQIAEASFWIGVTSLLPLPSMDGFIALISLITRFRGQPVAAAPKQQAVRAILPEYSRIIPVDQYKRRNNVSDIHFKLGTDYHQRNRFDDAIARYRQAIANDQHFGPAYINLGLAYLAKGRRREAIHAFRGAIQFADDQKSHQAAWYQLHQLSEVSPVGEDAADNLAELGAAPWTDTTVQPNWLGLGIGLAVLLIGAIIFYGYLFSGLAEML